jgi:hypothetical protein
MYKLAFLAFFTFAFGQRPLTAQGRQQDVPSGVQRSFHRDYPEARDPRWSSSHSQWHADFNDQSRYDRGAMVAHYDQGGRHLDSHIPYDHNDVPSAVVDRSQSHYPDGRGYTYTRIEQPGARSLFQVNLNLQGRNKTLYMDENGRERKYHDSH